jgi:hypothetical protein
MGIPSKKPLYKIREVQDANGITIFHIMARFGWLWPFDWYYSYEECKTLKEANNIANGLIKRANFRKNSNKKVFVKEYFAEEVPKHIPEVQEERYISARNGGYTKNA